MLQIILILSALSTALLAGEPGRYRVFRSEDHGRSWSRSDAGLPTDSRINAFSASEDSIVAGTDSGIFIARDSGKSWQKSGLTGPNSRRIIALAATDIRLFAGTGQTILSSIDSGRTWQTNQTFPPRIIRSLLSLDGALYVGTDDAGVYKTTDLASTSNRWTQLAGGLPPNAQVLALTSLDTQIFAGLYEKGLYRWNDSEQKWFQVGAAAEIKPLVLAASGKTLIAGHNPGGIYRSADLGETWKPWILSTASAPSTEITASFPSLSSILNNDRTVSLPPVQAPIWEMAADSRIAVAGAGSGILYSADGARTWNRAKIDTKVGLPSNSPGIAFLVKENFILAAVHEKVSGCEERERE